MSTPFNVGTSLIHLTPMHIDTDKSDNACRKIVIMMTAMRVMMCCKKIYASCNEIP